MTDKIDNRDILLNRNKDEQSYGLKPVCFSSNVQYEIRANLKVCIELKAFGNADFYLIAGSL